MATGKFWFHDNLRVFLSKAQTEWFISVEFRKHETVKHIIEAMGVPHTEVDVILVNGKAVDFGWKPQDGDRVEVYPRSCASVETQIKRLQPEFKIPPKFILDGHLGKLAVYLRLLGFDVKYQNDISDQVIAETSSRENRFLLTRDRGLLKRSIVQNGYFVRAKFPRDQVVEILDQFHLHEFAEPFSRCTKCNGKLRSVSKNDVYERLEPKTKLYYDEFRLCAVCDQIYWKGSHFNRLEKFIRDLINLDE